jgi:hypothetical protein
MAEADYKNRSSAHNWGNKNPASGELSPSSGVAALHPTDPRMPKTSPDRDMVLLLCAAGAIAVAIFPLLMPSHLFDRGIFVSVAERLLVGDRLYAGVWDNKGPLFFYLVALERQAGSVGEIFFELLFVLLASYSVFRLLTVFSSRQNAVLGGLIASPIVLTGAYYFPGYTHLPAIALTFAALALIAEGRTLASGFVLGLILFANILVAPVALCAVLALRWRCWSAAACFRLVLGIALSLLLFGVLLLARGELQPFLNSLVLNLAYSQGSLVKGHGLAGRVLSHLSLINFNRAKIIAAAILVCLLYAHVKGKTDNDRILLRTATLSLLASGAVLAATGLWRQHLQLLSIPAILSVAAVLVGGRESPVPLRLASAIILSWIVSGVPGLAHYGEAASRLADNWKQLNAISPDTIAIMTGSAPSTYARLGKNDENGHAIGLSKWNLGCPRFHQYPFDTQEQLNNTLACAARVDTILVTPSFAPEPDQPGWNRFVADGEKMLASAFHCRRHGALRLCRRAE